MIKCICYDLDNTLYDEASYFYGAFESIADYIADYFEINRVTILGELVRLFNKKGSLYPYLFNDTLKQLNISFDSSFILKLVKIFHSAEPNLILYDDVLPALKKLRLKQMRLGLISNGYVETQRRKVKILHLESMFDELIFPKEYGKEKPDPYIYNLALERFKIKPYEAIYVGDNPVYDFYGATISGMHTIRIRRGAFADLVVASEKNAQYEIHNHQEILKIIDKIEKKI